MKPSDYGEKDLYKDLQGMVDTMRLKMQSQQSQIPNPVAQGNRSIAGIMQFIAPGFSPNIPEVEAPKVESPQPVEALSPEALSQKYKFLTPQEIDNKLKGV
jgi:hypothetical protein